MILKWLRGIYAWFLIKPQAQIPRQYQIIEVEKGIPNRGDDAAIATLRDHPGFVALMNRLNLKKAYLKAQLETRHESLRDVDILVTGIAWIRYLEFEISAAVGKASKAPAPASLDEVELFNKISTAIESIGSQDRN